MNAVKFAVTTIDDNEFITE